MTNNPPALDLSAIRERCEKATEGPWVTRRGLIRPDADGRDVETEWKRIPASLMKKDGTLKKGAKLLPYRVCDGFSFNGACHKDDAEFIAHARTDIPALCDEIERLRAELEKK